MEHILSMQHVTKNYGRFCLQDITLALPKGCIMGLIGENLSLIHIYGLYKTCHRKVYDGSKCTAN